MAGHRASQAGEEGAGAGGTPRSARLWGIGAAGAGTAPVPGAPRGRCEGPRGDRAAPRCLLRAGGWHQGRLLEGGGGQVGGVPARQGVVDRSSISHPGPESIKRDSNNVMFHVPGCGGSPSRCCLWVSQRMPSRHSSRTSPLYLQDTLWGGLGGRGIAEHARSTRGLRAFNEDNKK